MANIIVPKIQEYTWHPWTASTLMINGVQYTSVANTAANDTNATINTMSFGLINTDYPHAGRGTLKEVEIGLTMALQGRQSSNAIMTYWLQGRNSPPPDYTWVTLSAGETNIPGTSFTDVTLAGRAQIQTNFNKVPFQLRAVYQCNQTNEGSAKIKSSSYVRWIYEIGWGK